MSVCKYPTVSMYPAESPRWLSVSVQSLGATRFYLASPAWQGGVAFKTSLSGLFQRVVETLQPWVMETPKQREGGKH